MGKLPFAKSVFCALGYSTVRLSLADASAGEMMVLENDGSAHQSLLSAPLNSLPTLAEGSNISKTIHGERDIILPLPIDLEEYSYEDIRTEHFDCRGRDKSQPLHSLEEWQFMRRKYNEVVDASVKFDDAIPPTLGYTLSGGSPPPFYAKLSPGKGRGLFASREINEGELIHIGGKSAVTFPNGMSWRMFVFSLPRDLACDIAMWSWTQSLSMEGEYQILVDLNIAAFFNDGGDDHSNIKPQNSTSLNFYAIRDIKKDTELMYDYHEYDTDWDEVGL
mmetsp:Transcript_21968/g.46355  ORF Transcript_21968/g.46355 Transcript_21968/m.46355 type:complete len:277 (+) Transcript_21968:214-1044(+)